MLEASERNRLAREPSDDGICPGMPLHVQVKRGAEPLLRRNSQLMPTHVRVLTAGERAWLVLEDVARAEWFELPAARTDGTWTRPGGVDFAETCL